MAVVTFKCKTCNDEWSSVDGSPNNPSCPSCGSTNIDVQIINKIIERIKNKIKK